MPGRGLTVVVRVMVALIAPSLAAAAEPGRDGLLVPVSGAGTVLVAAPAHRSRPPVVRRRPPCPLPGRGRRARALTVVARRGSTIVTARSHLSGGGDADIIAYMGCVRPRGPLRLITTATHDGYSTDDVFGFALGGPYVAYQRHTRGDGRIQDVPDLYYVTGFDLATGRQTFSAQSGYVDGVTILPPPVTHTAFAVKTLVAGATGAVAWLSYTTSFRTTVTTTTSTSTMPGATSTTTSTTTTKHDPVTTYEITAHDGLGTRVLDSAAKTGPRPPLAGLGIADRTVTWLHDGQPRSAAIR